MPLKDQIFTQAIIIISHQKGSVAGALSCRHCLFHSSTIPQLLSNEQSTKIFFETGNQHRPFYALFALSDTYQFSQRLIITNGLDENWFLNSVLNPLLETKRYFSCSLQSCEIACSEPEYLIPALAKIRSLHRLVRWNGVSLSSLMQTLETFQGLETLELRDCRDMTSSHYGAIPSSVINSSRTLKHLDLQQLRRDPLPFVKLFPNLISIDLGGISSGDVELNLDSLARSHPKIKKLILSDVTVGPSIDALDAELEVLELWWVPINSLNFLQSSRHSLQRLVLHDCFQIGDGSSFEINGSRLIGNLEKLETLHVYAPGFDDECLAHFATLESLRELELSDATITSAGLCHLKSMKQLEKLNLHHCDKLGGIESSSSSSHFRELFGSLKSLKEIQMHVCNLQNADLEGMVELAKTLTALDISNNRAITDEGVKYLLPLQILEKLEVRDCTISDEAIRILFAENPNSFPHLHDLDFWFSARLTEELFFHLAENNNLRCNLRSLTCGLSPSLKCISSWICRLTRLENLCVNGPLGEAERDAIIRSLKNLKSLQHALITDAQRAAAAAAMTEKESGM